MTADAAGNLLVAAGSAVWKVAPNGTQTIVAGNGNYGAPSGDNGLASRAQLNGPTAVTMNAAGDLFIADNAGRTIRKVTSDGIIGAVASVPGVAPGEWGDGGPAIGAQLRLAFPGLVSQSGLAVDRAGNLYIAETAAHRIRMVSPSGIITTIAGTGAQRCSGPSDCLPLGDGGPATSASLYFPTSVVVDNAGNLFIADSANFRVRKVSTDGTISTVAGTGSAPVWPRAVTSDGSAIAASILPSHVAVDGAGNLYFTESGYADVRKVLPDGTIHTALASDAALSYSGFLSAFTVDPAAKRTARCRSVRFHPRAR
jgi:trimeric autotransporter adhesin